MKRKKYSRNTYRYSKRKKQLYTKIGLCVLLILTQLSILYACIGKQNKDNTGIRVDASKPEIDVQLLDVNEYSRPGIESDGITGIVIHYTANPGSTAQENRDYFNGLKDSGETSVSSNFVIGLEGEIIQCVPTWEVAYASNERNRDTVSIECCHPDKSGEFTKETYRSAVQLTAWLCEKFGLTENEVIRHYDVTGKNCPKYFVENEKAWELFKGDVKAAMERSEEGAK
ncbi:peptidoglycan recognition protein family protein [Faecalicatena acetigenes]|uniref:N-acetylmuramoyl-L-alanine amidase n=1 Tax=Faecalicatena acetigenes TaxID=2981790 RepID=A0ABT2TDN4_9FIRM|nr:MULTISPECIES: peptidoglycan recognition family protein [Lachnospiraceae]MCU6747911.1 peptidoglycan recognition protein family protein [Faecalicatena acetigenes]